MVVVKLAGQMTDSGGGGTLESVAKELKALGLQNDIYSIGSCTLHLLQLALATPMKKVFGDGGTHNLNVMQLLHSCYNSMVDCFCCSIPEIHNDLLFLVGFHKAWFNCHFEWLQKSDESLHSEPFIY